MLWSLIKTMQSAASIYRQVMRDVITFASKRPGSSPEVIEQLNNRWSLKMAETGVLSTQTKPTQKNARVPQYDGLNDDDTSQTDTTIQQNTIDSNPLDALTSEHRRLLIHHMLNQAQEESEGEYEEEEEEAEEANGKMEERVRATPSTIQNSNAVSASPDTHSTSDPTSSNPYSLGSSFISTDDHKPNTADSDSSSDDSETEDLIIPPNSNSINQVDNYVISQSVKDIRMHKPRKDNKTGAIAQREVIKFSLKDGIMHLNGKDYIFSTCEAEFSR